MNLSPFFEKELEEPLWGRGGPCSASHDPGGPQALAGRTRCPGRRLGDSRGPSHGRSLPPAVSRRQTGGQDHAVSLASVTLRRLRKTQHPQDPLADTAARPWVALAPQRGDRGGRGKDTLGRWAEPDGSLCPQLLCGVSEEHGAATRAEGGRGESGREAARCGGAMRGDRMGRFCGTHVEEQIRPVAGIEKPWRSSGARPPGRWLRPDVDSPSGAGLRLLAGQSEHQEAGCERARVSPRSEILSCAENSPLTGH